MIPLLLEIEAHLRGLLRLSRGLLVVQLERTDQAQQLFELGARAGAQRKGLGNQLFRRIDHDPRTEDQVRVLLERLDRIRGRSDQWRRLVGRLCRIKRVLRVGQRVREVGIPHAVDRSQGTAFHQLAQGCDRLFVLTLGILVAEDAQIPAGALTSGLGGFTLFA